MPTPLTQNDPLPASELKKPGLGPEYEVWLAKERQIENLRAHENNYNTVCRELSDSFQRSNFWVSVVRDLPNIDAQYLIENKFPLVSTYNPEIVIKSWSSFLQKSYRKNIVKNEAFPNPPPDGWYLPPEWYSQIHDIVRTTIVVKYIDGVPLVLRRLQDLAVAEGLNWNASLETREDGYYGAHFNCRQECEISTMQWSKERRPVDLEIQITTQIKDVIKRLLHTYYETHRMSGTTTRLADIAWNYREDEFVATYLGHILHYVEGMIIEVRDRKRSENA